VSINSHAYVCSNHLPEKHHHTYALSVAFVKFVVTAYQLTYISLAHASQFVCRTQLAAHTAKERQDWMNAITEATVRSGSAGASSSKGGTPVASSHKRYSSLEHTPIPVREPGETDGSVSPPQIPLLPMNAVTQAAAAEASLQVATLYFCCASLFWCLCILAHPGALAMYDCRQTWLSCDTWSACTRL